jgi:hypothetical protein
MSDAKSASGMLASYLLKMLKITPRQVVFGRRKLNRALQYLFCFVIFVSLQ